MLWTAGTFSGCGRQTVDQQKEKQKKTEKMVKYFFFFFKME
jgi:hypothetical protein